MNVIYQRRGRWLLVAMVLCVLTLLAVAFLSYRQTNQVIKAAEAVTHTQVVLMRLHSVLAKVSETETNQRNYILMGDDKHLEEYVHTAESLRNSLGELEALTMNVPVHQDPVRRLRLEIKTKLNNMNKSINVRKTQGFGAAWQTLKSGEEHDVTPKIRKLINQMQSKEQAVMTEQIEQLRDKNERNLIVFSGLVGTTVFLFGLSFYFATVYLGEHMRSEEILKEQLRRLRELRELLDLAHDAIIVREPDGTISFWNRGAQELYGWSPEEAISRNADELMQPEASKSWEIVQEALTKQRRWEAELVHRTRSGEKVIINSRWSPKLDQEGRLARVLEINENITDRKEAEEKLIAMTNSLKRTNEELRQFAYVASHDLQEPLRVVGNYTQLLEKRYKEKLDEKGTRFMNHIVEAVRRMRGLINDLLSYSRIETRGGEKKEASSDKMLDQALDNLSMGIEESGATITRDELPVIVADRGQMARLFQNLVSNAIKFRGENPPEIHVSARETDEGWLFSVKDNGIGISMEYSDKIFQIFQQLHPNSEYKGSGIGLAICKRIIERHGGEIWVESEPGAGSCFYFTIPKIEPEGEGIK